MINSKNQINKDHPRIKNRDEKSQEYRDQLAKDLNAKRAKWKIRNELVWNHLDGDFKKSDTSETQTEMTLEQMSQLEQLRSQLPPLLLIYRNNPFYEKNIEKIKSIASLPGRKVEVITFPASTTEEDIKKWNEENIKKILKSVVSGDQTYNSSSWKYLKFQWKKKRWFYTELR